VSDAVGDLESSALIDVDRSGNMNILELTREGWRTWKTAVGVQEPKTSDSVSLHNFSVRFEIRNGGELEEGWRERWIQGKTQRYTYDPTNDSYVYFLENWRVRITGEHVIVRLESELRGEDPVNLKDRALLEIFDAAEWVQDNSPVRVKSHPSDFRIWVQRQHLAILQDPFCQLVDQYSAVELEDVRIFDESGTERLWLDDSKGEKHLEGGCAPGENREFAEDDIEFLKSELYEWLISNKSAWTEIQRLGEALSVENNGLSVEALRDATGGSVRTAEAEELTISSVWVHRFGHLMGWAEELGKPVRVIDREKLVST